MNLNKFYKKIKQLIAVTILFIPLTATNNSKIEHLEPFYNIFVLIKSFI